MTDGIESRMLRAVMARTISNTIPLPDPDIVVDDNGVAWNYATNSGLHGRHYYTADQLHAHAAAVSAAKDKEIAALRETFHAAKAVGIQQESIIMKQERRIKVLEDAVKHYEAALKARWPEGAMGESFGHWNDARAALEQKP